MKLTGFKYLERKRTLTLAVILTLSSMLFSLTALSLLGFYKGFTAYLGGEKTSWLSTIGKAACHSQVLSQPTWLKR